MIDQIDINAYTEWAASVAENIAEQWDVNLVDLWGAGVQPHDVYDLIKQIDADR